MKKLIVLTTFLVAAFIVGAQTKFETAMLANIDSMNQSFGSGTTAAAIQQFERIASAEPSHWEPMYYTAYAYCILSFKQQNPALKETLCKLAQTALDAALKIAPHESEIYVIQGFIYNGQLMVNPQTLGMTLMPKIHAAYDAAIRMNPENPRAYYMKGLMVMNTPAFAGGGKDKALPLFTQAQALYTSFKPLKSYSPNWGKTETASKLIDCQR
jgi:pectin methylesterase-like acyl-CoA thioesterase